MKIHFPRLEIWQKEVFDDVQENRYDVYVVKARRQCGKSILAICVALFFSFKSKKATTTIVEPTLAQSRRVFKQILSALGGDGCPLIKSANATLLTIEFSNGSEIIFKSAEQKEALRGMTVKRGILIVDEAAFIDKEIFEILYPIVDANRCPVMLLSTPLFLSGEFYEKYTLGLGLGTVHSYDWSKYDTSKYLSAEKLQFYRETISKLKFQSEYLGEFIAEGSYIFGDISSSVKGYSDKPPVYAGIDWSLGNDGDYSVMTMMDEDGAVTEIVAVKDFESVELVNKFSDIINSHKTLKTVQVEINSMGKVYYDLLKRQTNGKKIKPFTTTNESKRTIIENLIAAFQTDKVRVPSEPELIKELQHYNVEKTKNGYTYNGENGTHDDYVMSLAFCYDAYRNGAGKFEISFA